MFINTFKNVIKNIQIFLGDLNIVQDRRWYGFGIFSYFLSKASLKLFKVMWGKMVKELSFIYNTQNRTFSN